MEREERSLTSLSLRVEEKGEGKTKSGKSDDGQAASLEKKRKEKLTCFSI